MTIKRLTWNTEILSAPSSSAVNATVQDDIPLLQCVTTGLVKSTPALLNTEIKTFSFIVNYSSINNHNFVYFNMMSWLNITKPTAYSVSDLVKILIIILIALF
jgi:hypothetical protein